MKMRPIPGRVRLGFALRQMVQELKYPKAEPGILKVVFPEKVIFREGNIPWPVDYEELTLVEPKSIYPLKRDPKTGRMMKPERSE
jgi:hypothetical protein